MGWIQPLTVEQLRIGRAGLEEGCHEDVTMRDIPRIVTDAGLQARVTMRA